MRRRGVTLIEAVLFTATALGLIVGGIVFYQQASFASRMAELVRLTTTILAEANGLALNHNLTPGNGGGDVDLSNAIVKMGVVPDHATHTWDNGISVILHPWSVRPPNPGYRIQVRLSSFGNGGQPNLHLIFLNIPPEVCARIVPFEADGSGLFGGGQSMVSFLWHNGNDWVNPADYQNLGAESATGRVIGINPTDAGAYCRSAPQPMGVSLHFQPGRI